MIIQVSLLHNTYCYILLQSEMITLVPEKESQSRIHFRNNHLETISKRTEDDGNFLNNMHWKKGKKKIREMTSLWCIGIALLFHVNISRKKSDVKIELSA